MLRMDDPEAEIYRSKRHLNKMMKNLLRWKMINTKRNPDLEPPKGNVKEKAYFLYFTLNHPKNTPPIQQLPEEILTQVNDRY